MSFVSGPLSLRPRKVFSVVLLLLRPLLGLLRRLLPGLPRCSSRSGRPAPASAAVPGAGAQRPPRRGRHAPGLGGGLGLAARSAAGLPWPGRRRRSSSRLQFGWFGGLSSLLLGRGALRPEGHEEKERVQTLATKSAERERFVLRSKGGPAESRGVGMGDGEEGGSGVEEEVDPEVLETDPTGRFSRVRAPNPPSPPRAAPGLSALCADAQSVCTARSPRRGAARRPGAPVPRRPGAPATPP